MWPCQENISFFRKLEMIFLSLKTGDFGYEQVLGFGEYIEEVYAAYEQHKYETMVIILYLFSYSFKTDK